LPRRARIGLAAIGEIRGHLGTQMSPIEAVRSLADSRLGRAGLIVAAFSSRLTLRNPWVRTQRFRLWQKRTRSSAVNAR